MHQLPLALNQSNDKSNGQIVYITRPISDRHSYMYDLVPNAHISAVHRVVASGRIGVSYGQNSATTERHSGVMKTSVFISVLGYGSTICWTVQKRTSFDYCRGRGRNLS